MTITIDDLVSEILLRVPLKPLITFQLVSKHWCSLIRDPKFRHRWSINRKSATPAGVIMLRRKSWYEYLSFTPNQLTLPSLTKLDFVDILDSCNGILLCLARKMPYVCNPATRQYHDIPKLLDWDKILGMNLIFDPEKPDFFKIFCVRRFGLVYEILVYSSESDYWIWTDPLFNCFEVKFGFGVYWNGAINWVSDHVDGDWLYFEIDNHMIRNLPKPPNRNCVDQVCHHSYFGASSDHLHFIWFCKGRVNFNIYEMKRDYSEWFIKYQVNLNFIEYTSFHAVIRGVKEEDSFLLLSSRGLYVIRYNLVSGIHENLHKFNRIRGKVAPCGVVFPYIESLYGLGSTLTC